MTEEEGRAKYKGKRRGRLSTRVEEVKTKFKCRRRGKSELSMSTGGVEDCIRALEKVSTKYEHGRRGGVRDSTEGVED